MLSTACALLVVSSAAADFVSLQEAAECTPGPLLPGKDIPGGDYRQAVNVTYDTCAKLCCEDPKCKAWTYASVSPITFGKCVTGHKCCSMKDAYSTPTDNAKLISGSVSKHTKCTPGPLLPGKDIPGGDYRQAVNVTHETCAKLCCEDPKCKAWTYASVSPITFGKCVTGHKCCSMKDAYSTPTENAKLISGSVVKHNECAPSPFLIGKDIPGGDYRQEVNVSYETCSDLCCADPKCKAWTYASVSPITFGKCVTGHKCCSMKDANSTPTDNAKLISGFVLSQA